MDNHYSIFHQLSSEQPLIYLLIYLLTYLFTYLFIDSFLQRQEGIKSGRKFTSIHDTYTWLRLKTTSLIQSQIHN